MLPILWRRLDTPGHDACRLDPRGAGWRLQGTCVFEADAGPARLHYRVDCDAAWRTRAGRVDGWIGSRAICHRVRHAAAGWTLDGRAVPAVEGTLDLDLSVTPATNLLQLCRLALAVGQRAEAPAAWLDVEAGTLSVLPQSYERRSEATYWYEAPSVGYRGLLAVEPGGFVRHYPGLWEAVAPKRPSGDKPA